MDKFALTTKRLVLGHVSVCQGCCCGTKLLISFLALLISADSSGAALICAASCRLSPTVAGAVVRHHKMESQPSATSASQHTHYHDGACAGCLRKAGNSLNQTSDCNSPLEIRALTEGSSSFDAPTGVAQTCQPDPPMALPYVLMVGVLSSSEIVQLPEVSTQPHYPFVSSKDNLAVR